MLYDNIIVDGSPCEDYRSIIQSNNFTNSVFQFIFKTRPRFHFGECIGKVPSQADVRRKVHVQPNRRQQPRDQQLPDVSIRRQCEDRDRERPHQLRRTGRGPDSGRLRAPPASKVRGLPRCWRQAEVQAQGFERRDHNRVPGVCRQVILHEGHSQHRLPRTGCGDRPGGSWPIRRLTQRNPRTRLRGHCADPFIDCSRMRVVPCDRRYALIFLNRFPFMELDDPLSEA